MLLRVTLGCAGVFFLCLAARPAVSQDYKPGDEVVVIADAKLKKGNTEIDDVWPGLVLKVREVNGKWLSVSNGKPGWLDQQHVIPLNRAAIDRLTTMIRESPRSAALYSGRADVWKHLGELDIAIGDFNEAIRLDPDEAYYNNRGNAWYSKAEYDKAIEDYNEARARRYRLVSSDAGMSVGSRRSRHPELSPKVAQRRRTTTLPRVS